MRAARRPTSYLSPAAGEAVARPRVDKYLAVDGFLLARIRDENRNNTEAATTIIRRVVKGCLNLDAEFLIVLGNFLPALSPGELRREHVALVLGASEAAVVRRLLRRIEPQRVRLRGEAALRGLPPQLGAPYLKLDTRRGRRPKSEV